MSDAEIRAALRLTNGDVAQAVLLLSEPLAGPKTTKPKPTMRGGVTGKGAGKTGKLSDPYRSVSRVAETIDKDAQATTGLYQSFAIDTGNLTDKERIGSGGFGTVYRVTDRVTRKNYALKEFKSSNITNNSVIRELVMLSSVNPARLGSDDEMIVENSNVVGFFGASTTWQRSDGTVGPAILSEFINGKELHHIRTPDIWKHAVRMSKELFSGLAFIHGKGVAHGDIKPENIMVERASDGGPYGRVVIVDLGLACFVDYKLASSVSGYLGEKYTCKDKLEGTYIFLAPDFLNAHFLGVGYPLKVKFDNDVWAATLSLFEAFANFRYYEKFPEFFADDVKKNITIISR